MSTPAPAQNAYNFEFSAIDGKTIKLSDFKGKVILIVNTASHCGYTGQYKELQELYSTYKDKGLVVLGVPSADFGGQEFDSEDKVQDFTEKKFSVTFPLTAISSVKGKDAHPFYKWAGDQGGFLSGPKWNFHKYIIAKNGDYVTSFATTTSPKAPSVIKVIEEQLAKP